MQNLTEIAGEILSRASEKEVNFSKMEQNDGVLVCLSTISRDSHYIVPTLDLLIQQLENYPGSQIICGWNDGVVHPQVIADLNVKKIPWEVHEQMSDESYVCATRSNRDDDRGVKVTMINPRLGRGYDGKLGMHHDIEKFVTSDRVSNWSAIPSNILMMDSESHFDPSVENLIKKYQDNPNNIAVATCRHNVYDGSYPSSRIPISIYHEMSNFKHTYEGYLTGGGYVGNTVRVLSALSAIHDVVPGIVAEDAALAVVNRLQGGNHRVMPEVHVSNKTSPVWDREGWTQQLHRWSVTSKVVSKLIGEGVENRISSHDARILTVKAIYHNLIKAIIYQRIDNRSLPYTISTIKQFVTSMMRKKIKRSNKNNQEQLDYEFVFNSRHATW